MRGDKLNLIKNLSKRQLIELDACTRCGYCVEWCPVVTASEDYINTPMDKIQKYKNFIQSLYGLKARLLGPNIDEEELRNFANELYKCTTCGRCGAVCSVGIHCQELWIDVRATMRELGFGPQDKIDAALEIMERVHNPFDLPIEERNDWIPEDIKISEKAELAFFVGCELAYKAKPMAQGAVKLLNASNIPFTIFKDEWCCGFPLYVLGERGEEFAAEVEKNVEGLKAKGVKRVAPYCPCCLNVMKRAWPEVKELPFELVHILKIIADAVENGRLKFTRSFKGKVTYHDPCYLSRGWGSGENLIQEPRTIINSIPGVELVEMEHNKQLSLCPGSGGGLRRTNLELSHKMSIPVLKEAEATGAEVLLTACPAVYERFKMTVDEKIYEPKLEVMDVLEFASFYL
jgi:heterodisulfide reductase subunit D